MEIYSTKETSKILKLSIKTLYNFDVSGKLVAHRHPNGRKFYTETQIEEYLKACGDTSNIEERKKLVRDNKE